MYKTFLFIYTGILNGIFLINENQRIDILSENIDHAFKKYSTIRQNPRKSLFKHFSDHVEANVSNEMFVRFISHLHLIDFRYHVKAHRG